MFAVARWVLLLVLFLGPRLYVLNRDGVVDHPHCELEMTAACLVENGYLGNPYMIPTGPSAHVAPLYPLVLAALYKVAGTGTTAHYIQAMLSLAIVFAGTALMPRLSKRIWNSELPGWLGAYAFCFLPYSVGYVQVFGHWEQHVSFLAVMLFLPCLLSISRDGWPTLKRTIQFGAFTGLLLLTSPQFMIVFGLFVLHELSRGPNRVHRLKQAIIAGVVAGLVVMPWTIRNYVQLKGFCPVRSNGPLEFAIGNHDLANGSTHVTAPKDPDSPMRKMHPLTSEADAISVKDDGELKYMKRRQTEAMDWIKSHPERFAVLTMARVQMFWLPEAGMWAPDTGSLYSRRMRSLAYAIPAVMAFVGLILLLLRDPRTAFIVACVILGMSGAYYVSHVDVRYIFPLHGLILVLAMAIQAWLVRKMIPTTENV